MDITKFVVSGRDQALLYGDYATYHAQSTKRLLNARRKLGIATKNRGKYQKKEPVTAENIAQNHEYVHLLLLTSERAWAQAMSMKASHTTDQQGSAANSQTRSHIVSRLDKASKTAQDLAQILSDSDASGASANDILEAKAYAALIRGAMLFEKQNWEPCVRSYAVSRVVYSALGTSAKGDVFKDLLSDTIDPSIRYAAYQLKTPRTIPIQAIARNAFPQTDEFLVQEINKIDPSILKEGEEGASEAESGDNAPKTLTWRSREVRIEDAQIAIAWASVQSAKTRLTETVAARQDRSLHEIASAYDEILTATQDAVDATKQAIDEMRGEGVAQGDPRMQSLQITRTAVNYEMISWRIGRNRVLTGPRDGATEEYGSTRRRKKVKADEATVKELPPSRKLAKLKEKVALYDGTLQNLESIKELPGVAADEKLASKIDAYEKYFQALKCLSIGRSHAIIGNVTNALALINHSTGICRKAASNLPEAADLPDSQPLNVEVSAVAIDALGKLLDGELQRHRAIVHIDNLRKDEKEHVSDTARSPLVERLHEYPAGGVDLDNIVDFPPKLAFIPMKPIFLDVAWNYIDYPGKVREEGSAQPKASAAAAQAEGAPAQPQKKGWFGFGRS